MSKLIFKIQKAKEHGRSPIEITISRPESGSRPRSGKICTKTVKDTDQVLPVLDILLKKSKLKVESLRDIKIEAHKEAGLTSLRIIKSITKALSFSL